MSNVIRTDTVPGLDGELLESCLLNWIERAVLDDEISTREVKAVKKMHDFLREDGVIIDPAQLATCLEDWIEADQEREDEGEYEDDPDFDPTLRAQVEAQLTLLRGLA